MPACGPQSCKSGGPGAGNNCGASGTDDCCASPLVPGGTFNRDNDPNYPATVSDFRLDKYEITVGRFRAFVNAGMGTQANPPAAGSDANPNVAQRVGLIVEHESGCFRRARHRSAMRFGVPDVDGEQ